MDEVLVDELFDENHEVPAALSDGWVAGRRWRGGGDASSWRGGFQVGAEDDAASPTNDETGGGHPCKAGDGDPSGNAESVVLGLGLGCCSGLARGMNVVRRVVVLVHLQGVGR